MKTWLWISLGIVAIIVAAVLGFLYGQAQTPITKTLTVVVDVQAAPDFTLMASPTSIITYPNRTIAFVLTATSNGTFAGDVVFSVSGLPSGMTATFFPSNKVTVGTATPGGVQLSIVIDTTVVVKTYNLTVTATSTVYN